MANYPKMELYLLRHGIAEDRAASGRDADRSLTDKGARKVREVMIRASAAGVAPEQIVTSPYRRARETARVAAEALGFTGALIDCAALTPDSSPNAAWDDLRPWRESPSVLIVGHEPLWSGLYAFLLNAPSLEIEVKKASLGCIAIDRPSTGPRGVLRWFITPPWCDPA